MISLASNAAGCVLPGLLHAVHLMFFILFLEGRGVKGFVVGQHLAAGCLHQVVITGKNPIYIIRLHFRGEEGHKRDNDKSGHHGKGACIDGGFNIMKEHVGHPAIK